MRRLLVVMFTLTCSFTSAQNTRFELKSAPTTVKIVTDFVAPSLEINPVRNLEKGYKLVQRDTAITLNGNVSDASGSVSLEVNDSLVPVTPSGKFAVRLRLRHGENQVHFKARDRKHNSAETTICVYQDPGADTSAPQITILQPSVGRGIMMVPRTPKVRVGGVTSDESPLAALYVNNRRMDSAQVGRFYCDIPTDTLRAISVKAVDSSGNFSIETIVLPPHYFSGESESVDLSLTGKYYALIIGVSKYTYAEDLKNPVSDAAKLQAVLLSRYTFDKENILLLNNPTREKILDGFEQIKKKVGSDDNFLIFYAGHGHVDPEADQGYWWPSDANPDNHAKWISNSDIREQIRRIKSRHTLLIADACFSGSVFRNMRDAQEDAPLPIQDAYHRKSRTALTSGEEAVPDESVFARILLQKLEENTARFLRANHLMYQMSDEVLSNSPNRQHPEYGKIQEADDGGGDFIFIRRHAESSDKR